MSLAELCLIRRAMHMRGVYVYVMRSTVRDAAWEAMCVTLIKSPACLSLYFVGVTHRK